MGVELWCMWSGVGGVVVWGDEIPEIIQDPIRKSRPLYLDTCSNKFVCSVSRIPVREICSLQHPSESM